MGCVRFFSNYFSQTHAVHDRKAKGLHPVDEMGRFYILTCGFFCSICVSVTYAFDLFTTEFRDRFGLSAGDLSTVSTVGLVFCYLLIPYSLIYEHTGPLVPFYICLLCGLVGALCLGLTFDGKIKGNTATITVFYAMLNTASGLIDATYISTLFEIFPRNRGPVVCLAKVMTGLGSSVLACMSANIFTGSISGFIYFLMALMVVVSLWASFVIVLPPYYMNWWRRRGKSAEEVAELTALQPYYEHKSVPTRRLAVGYVVVISLIIFFAVESPVMAYSKDVSRGSQVAIGVLAIVFTLCIFLMLLPVRWLGGMNEPAPSTEEVAAIEGGFVFAVPAGSSTDRELEKPPVEAGVQPTSDGDAALMDEEGPYFMDDSLSSPAQVPKEPLTVRAAARQDPRYSGEKFVDYLKMLDLWLILLCATCISPIGVLVSYNASTISVAVTGHKRSQQLSALYTAFLGVGSAVGRIAFGLFEAYVQSQDPNNRKIVITMALPICPIIVVISGILILVLPGHVILFPFILVYLENGFYAAMTALIFPCMFESFHNALYNMSFLVTVLCVVLFNRLLFGMYVDMKHKELGLPSHVECNQSACIRVPFIVCTCLGAAGFFLAVLVHVRYSRFVSRFRAASADTSAPEEYAVPPLSAVEEA